MILYELGNGKCVYLTVDQLLTLSDSDIQNHIATNSGFTANPFNHSKNMSVDDQDDQEDDEYEQSLQNSPDMLSDGDDDPYLDVDISQIPDS